MQKVFYVVNNNTVLLIPLILYSLISSVYWAISINNSGILNIILSLVIVVLMTSAFISGWFYMIKLSVLQLEQQNSTILLKEFLSGVGEYFVSSLSALCLILIVTSLFILGSIKLGLNFIGNPGISPETISNAIQNTAAMQTFLSRLSEKQVWQINQWNMLFLATMTLIYFIFMLYFPAIFFKNKNPYISFFISIKDLFSKKFFKTVGLFFILYIANFLISIISALSINIIIIHLIMTLTGLYFFTLAGVGIFYYYYNNFVAIEKC